MRKKKENIGESLPIHITQVKGKRKKEGK